jgi:hypothetical protein
MIQHYIAAACLAGVFFAIVTAVSSLPLSPASMSFDCAVENGRVSFEVHILEHVALEYYDSWNPLPGWRPLCTSCMSYARTLQYKPEGHNWLIQAMDREGNNVTIEIVDVRDKPIDIPGMIDCYWRPEIGEDGCLNVFGEFANEFGCTECEAYLGTYFDGEQCVAVSGCEVTEEIILFRTIEECQEFCT